MKKTLLTITAVAGLALIALAATPSYTTKTAAGNGTAGAEVIFPPGGFNSQVRIVSANWSSDTNIAVLSYSTGEAAFVQTQTNAATSSVTNAVASTNGLTPNSIMVLVQNGICYKATLSSFVQSTNGTNIVLGSGGWGVAVTPPASIYQMGTAVTVPVGATTNAANGEALFVGNMDRPVRVQLTPANLTNRLNSVTARYE